MSYLNKIDRLSEYIDAINSASGTSHIHDDPEITDLFDTVDQIQILKESELPSNEFVESVARKIRLLDQPKSLKKTINNFVLPKWFPVAATFLFVLLLFWQQFFHSYVDATQITVIKEKELIPLGQHEIENPIYIGGDHLISFGNNEKIWIWDPRTNEKKSLPQGPFQYMRNPSWSPDGLKVAFSGYIKGSAGIWTMNKDGSNIQEIIGPANINENDDTPVWSPDGKKLAFTKTVTEPKASHGFTVTKQEIWITNADGTDAKKLTNGKDPSWSPTGKKLSFTKTNDVYDSEEVWTIKVNGSEAKKLTDGMESSWSPDGQFIAFTKYLKKTEKISKMASIQNSFREIWVIHVKTHTFSQLTKGKADIQQEALWKQEVKMNPPKTPLQYVSSGLYSDWQPAWSRDGKSILFARDTNYENAHHFSLFKLDLQFE